MNKHIAFTFLIHKYNTFTSIGKTWRPDKPHSIGLQVMETRVRESFKTRKNECVSIKSIMTGENKILKYKVAKPFIEKKEMSAY